MPIKSEQQRKFMAMCLHNPEKAQGKCPPKSVAKKFIHGHSRKDETLNMNNYIDPRLALKSLFEAALQNKLETLDEARVDELLRTIGGLVGGVGRLGKKLTHYGGASFEGMRLNPAIARQHLAAAKGIKTDFLGGAQKDISSVNHFRKLVGSKLKRGYLKGKAMVQGALLNPEGSEASLKRAAAAKRAMKSVSDKRKASLGGGLAAGLAAGAVQGGSKPAETTRVITTGEEDPQQKRFEIDVNRGDDDEDKGQPKKKEESSTNHARLGLRALFEAVLEEKDILKSKEATAVPVGKLPKEKEAELSGELERRLKAARAAGAGTPVGGTGQGNPLTGRTGSGVRVKSSRRFGGR